MQQQSGESPHSNNSIVNICEACSNVSQSQRPDDTDSFTPRVRSDKKSIILLLGKTYIFEENNIFLKLADKYSLPVVCT